MNAAIPASRFVPSHHCTRKQRGATGPTGKRLVEDTTRLEVEGRTVGPFYSMAEVMLRGRREWVRSEMNNLHDRVMKLRGRVPPSPD